jgi:hypothetical protein
LTPEGSGIGGLAVVAGALGGGVEAGRLSFGVRRFAPRRGFEKRTANPLIVKNHQNFCG